MTLNAQSRLCLAISLSAAISPRDQEIDSLIDKSDYNKKQRLAGWMNATTESVLEKSVDGRYCQVRNLTSDMTGNGNVEFLNRFGPRLR